MDKGLRVPCLPESAMDLMELVREHPGFGCFEVSGNQTISVDLDQRLAKFFSKHPQEHQELTVTDSRGGAFSRLLHLRGDRGVILNFLSQDQVRGVATLSMRPGYVHGRKAWVGYLGDLRLDFERDLLRSWRRFYGSLLDLLNKWPGPDGTAGCLTCVVRTNERAIRALVQPHRMAPYRYVPFGDCRMVNIWGKAPLAWIRPEDFDLSGIHVREATAQDRDRLTEFIDQQQRRRAFGFCFEEELPRRLRVWPDFEIERFLLVEDRQGRLLATAAPWNPGDSRSERVERFIKPRLSPERVAARCFSGLQSYRPPRLPKEGEPLNILYLTHLEFDLTTCLRTRQAAFRSLLSRALDRHAGEPWHFLSFADFDDQSLRGALQGFYWLETPLSLYSVHKVEDDGLIRRPIKAGPHPPAFEPAIM